MTNRLQDVGKAAAKVGWKPGADTKAMWRGFTSLADRGSRRAFLATTKAVVDLGGQTVSAHSRLVDVEAPATLVVWGTQDRVVPVGMRARPRSPPQTSGWSFSRAPATSRTSTTPTGSRTCCANSSRTTAATGTATCDPGGSITLMAARAWQGGGHDHNHS